ncbi:hypothetical protein DLREEDagrD3_10880 [Denitratisoma sp. agr-D3]
MELAPQVEDLAKAIQSLPSLLDAVSTLPLSGWIVLVAFFLWLLANKNIPRVFDVLERKEKRRLEQFDAYVSSPNSGDANTIKVIQDLRDAHYFKIATGIYAESRVRNAFIKLHEATSHLITWRHICRAHPYLKVAADETVTVRELDFSEKLSYWYNQLSAYFFLLLSATLISLVILSGSKTLTSFSYGFGGGIVSALFAMFIFSQNWPVHAAKKIAKELEGHRSAGPDA